jgi:hypothetical protein
MFVSLQFLESIGRYERLDTTRAYAREKLLESVNWKRWRGDMPNITSHSFNGPGTNPPTNTRHTG